MLAQRKQAADFLEVLREPEDEFSKMLEPKGPFNRHCAICGATDIHFEEGPTKFKDLMEAAPWIDKTLQNNMVTRAYLERTGQMFDRGPGEYLRWCYETGLYMAGIRQTPPRRRPG
jgi:hypothetical protein